MKKLAALLVILFFLISVQAISAATEVSKLGNHPFHKSRNLTPEELKGIALNRAGDVKMGFEEVGLGDLVYAFLEQIQKSELETTEINPGDTLSWMFSKRGKKIVILKDVVWSAKKSTPAYIFKIFREGTLYEFLVPLVCANISLRSTEAIPGPVCSLKVSPEEVEIGQPVTLDVCESQNAVKHTITISDAAGAVVKTMELTPANCSATVTFDSAGSYTCEDIAEGEYGVKSAPCATVVKAVLPPPPPPVVVKKPFPLHLLLDVGLAQMKDPTNFLFLRIGAQYKASDSFRINFLVGPWFNLSDNGYGTPISADLLFLYYPSKFFIGGGVGGWFVSDDNKLDLIGELGYEFLTAKKFSLSAFFEYRVGVGDFDVIADFGRYGIGLRLCL